MRRTRWNTRRITLGLLLLSILLQLSVTSVSANRASSGDQPFMHYTTYFGGGGAVPFAFTSVSRADTDWEYYDPQWIKVYQHLVGTSVSNYDGYPFPFTIYGPHVYYRNNPNTYYYDVTSGSFSGISTLCNPNEKCAVFRATDTFYMDQPPITADSEIFINTGVQTIPQTHQDDLSPYSFQ